jgi:hypothetical protein
MSKDIEEKLPLYRALLYIALSVIAIWGTLFFAWWYHSIALEKRQNNAQFTLKTIVSSSKTGDSLTIQQIAELLHITGETPTNLYRIDPIQAKIELESYPAIKSAVVKRLRPNALFIEYELRTPYFLLRDFENVAIDKEGYPFYLFPIFTPKKIPELYVGIQDISWNIPIRLEEYTCAVELAEYIEKTYPKDIKLLRIDTHNMHNASRGMQEIVVIFEERARRFYVRLDVHEYKKGLKHFLYLRPGDTPERVVDLRYNGFALVKNLL